MSTNGGWTDRREDIACCPGPLGPVQPSERLARLLHTRIVEPDHDPLRRSEFFPPKGKALSNICGEADGSSVQRASGLSNDDLRSKSRSQAEMRPGRRQMGALIANAHDLRELRLPELGEHQLVFVYDDPLPEEERHAVVRALAELSRPDQDELREKIRSAFATRVPED